MVTSIVPSSSCPPHPPFSRPRLVPASSSRPPAVHRTRAFTLSQTTRQAVVRGTTIRAADRVRGTTIRAAAAFQLYLRVRPSGRDPDEELAFIPSAATALTEEELEDIRKAFSCSSSYAQRGGERRGCVRRSSSRRMGERERRRSSRSPGVRGRGSASRWPAGPACWSLGEQKRGTSCKPTSLPYVGSRWAGDRRRVTRLVWRLRRATRTRTHGKGSRGLRAAPRRVTRRFSP